MDQVRWGILGAAKIAREWVCPGIRAAGRGVVAAVASRTPGKAEALALPYGARTFANYEALLDDPGIDAVYVPLPNAEHVEWTLKALAAGKHVLTEKPIALAASEIDGLIAARDRAGKLAAEAFMVIHHPQWTRTRELVRGGAIGRLLQVQAAFSFLNRDPANIRNDAALGGGALRDIGVYPTVTTRFVTGAEPVAVTHAEIDWEAGIDASARVMATFPDFHFDAYVSMRMAPRQLIVFHGEEGFLTVRAPFNAQAYADQEIEIRASDGRIVVERFGLADQYRAQAEAFAASVLNGVPYPCPLEFSRGNQAFIDMIYAAAGPRP